MYKQIKDIGSIVFPVYKIPDIDTYSQDKILFQGAGKVLDDKNMSGNTLGLRRLQSGRTDLFFLKKAIPDFKTMLKTKHKYFIDNNGVPFEYVKTKNCPLVHHLISKIEPKETYSIVHLSKIPQKFSIPRMPYGDARWARVLYYGQFPWIIYDFANHKGQDSHRRA